jgi:hypothetical protein
MRTVIMRSRRAEAEEADFLKWMSVRWSDSMAVEGGRIPNPFRSRGISESQVPGTSKQLGNYHYIDGGDDNDFEPRWKMREGHTISLDSFGRAEADVEACQKYGRVE